MLSPEIFSCRMLRIWVCTLFDLDFPDFTALLVITGAVNSKSFGHNADRLHPGCPSAAPAWTLYRRSGEAVSVRFPSASPYPPYQQRNWFFLEWPRKPGIIHHSGDNSRNHVIDFRLLNIHPEGAAVSRGCDRCFCQ